jgi:hypothetical protein
MVAPVHNLDPTKATILLEGSAKLRWRGGGGQGQSSIDFIYFWGRIRSSEAAMGIGRGNESKKTGARSARARTRGQNLLVTQKREKLETLCANKIYRNFFFAHKSF